MTIVGTVFQRSTCCRTLRARWSWVLHDGLLPNGVLRFTTSNSQAIRTTLARGITTARTSTTRSYHGNFWVRKHFFSSTSPPDLKPSQTSTSDPPILTWIDSYLPSPARPYARLARIDKPIGTWLLLWPCAWSTALAAEAGHWPDPKLLGLFGMGAFIMRGAGCTINDLWDQDFDAKVSRTATRPLAAGEITTPQAIGFLSLQLSAGLAVLLSLPHWQYCFVWGASSLPLVVAYPLMKRHTNYPQLVLGLTFNWGAWMGWAATYGSMDYSLIAPLYLSGVTWTLVYDTIYANQDKVDDAKLGLKSTALTFGDDEQRHKRILHGLAGLTYFQWLMVGFQCVNNDGSGFAIFPFVVGVSMAHAHLIWQINTAQLNNPQNLAERFRSNTTVGALVFASIMAGKVF